MFITCNDVSICGISLPLAFVPPESYLDLGYSEVWYLSSTIVTDTRWRESR